MDYILFDKNKNDETKSIIGISRSINVLHTNWILYTHSHTNNITKKIHSPRRMYELFSKQ